MLFPTARSIVYRNEDGEPLGWDQPSDDEPDIDAWYESQDYDDDLSVEECKSQGRHGGDATQVDGDLWECDWCGETFSYSEMEASRQ